MTTDLILAILHHLVAFMLAGVLIAEMFKVRPGLSGPSIRILARIDGMYGGLWVLIIVIGVLRVIYGLKGWEYYVYYWAFWAKMFAFLVVGLLSIPPTLRFIGWRKAAEANAGHVVSDVEIATVRTYIRGEAAFLALVIIFASVMARGVGY